MNKYNITTWQDLYHTWLADALYIWSFVARDWMSSNKIKQWGSWFFPLCNDNDSEGFSTSCDVPSSGTSSNYDNEEKR